jgi:hypothetical protein
MSVLFILSLLIVGAVCQVPCPTINGIEYPDLQGKCNNQQNPQWASQNHVLLRTNINGNPPWKGGVADYADGIGQMIKRERASLVSVREITNLAVDQPDNLRICTPSTVSDFSTYFGQFLNHDMNRSPTSRGINAPGAGTENAFIPVPAHDPFFENYVAAVPFMRTDVQAGTGVTTPREQFDVLTAYIDLGTIYCVAQPCADLLREFSGGRLLADPTNPEFLPTLDYLCNFQAVRQGLDPLTFAPGCIATLGISMPHRFSTNTAQTTVSGDVRVNENFGLLAMHHLFFLNHNYHAQLISSQNPGANDTEIYYRARAWNIAEFQKISYDGYLEHVLGVMQPAPYTGYDPTVDAGSNNEFVTAAFRHGHSQISAEILRRYNNGSYARGDTFLRDTYFQSDRFKLYGGTATLLHGMRYQKAQPVDLTVIDGLRNFLFGPGDPSLGMDLISINLQRGRDHGILTFNDVRRAYGLRPYDDFLLLTRNRLTANKLRAVYASVDDCDLWICGVAERPYVKNAIFGETFATILKNQFERARVGDRFYWLNQCGKIFTQQECAAIDATVVDDIIGRITDRPTSNSFFVSPRYVDSCVKSQFLYGEKVIPRS